MAWSRTSRHARGYGTKHDKIRAHLLATEPLCRECHKQGRTTVATIADHINPLAKGGSSEADNYQPLCAPCHDDKTIRESGGRPKSVIQFTADGRPIW